MRVSGTSRATALVLSTVLGLASMALVATTVHAQQPADTLPGADGRPPRPAPKFTPFEMLPGNANLSGPRVTLTPGSTSKLTVAPGAKIRVPVFFNMTAASGLNVASITVTLTWNAPRLTLDSIKQGNFGSMTPNTAGAASGNAVFTAFTTIGTTASDTVAVLYFSGSATNGGTTLQLTPTVAGNDAGTSILGAFLTRPTAVCVGSGGKWGDVNGDSIATPQGDGNVNIIDAQQIARYSVGLTVANRPGLVARGDVTNDGAVNIIDAQQIARYSVGLSAAARLGQSASPSPIITSLEVLRAPAATIAVGDGSQMLVSPKDSVANRWDGCVPVTWSSSNTSAATVDSLGFVSGMGNGTALITATAGGQTGTATVTVGTGVAVTGLHLSLTSSAPTQRYVVMVQGGAIPSGQYIAAQTRTFARSATLDVPLPGAGTYLVRAYTLDSLAADTSDGGSPNVSATGGATGLVVNTNAATSATIALTVPTITYTAAPTTMAAGDAPQATVQVADQGGWLAAYNRGAYLYVSTAAPWTSDENAWYQPNVTWSFFGWPSFSGAMATYSRPLPAVARPDTLYWQPILVLADLFVEGRWQYPQFALTSLRRGEPLRQTVVTAAAQGIRVTLTSPVPFGRFLVRAEPQICCTLQTVSSLVVATGRSATTTIGVPAGSWRIVVWAADSADASYYAASGRSGVLTVAAGVTTDVAMALNVPSTTFVTDSVQYVGTNPLISWIFNDSTSLSSSWWCGEAIAGTTGYVNNGEGASRYSACNSTQTAGGRQYFAALDQQNVPATLYYQVQNYVSTNTLEGYFFVARYAPDLARGGALRTVSVITATTGISLTLSSPTATGNFRVVVDSGGLGMPREFNVVPTDTLHATVQLPLPAGTGYRVRVYARDLRYYYQTVSASLRRSGVNVSAGAFTALTMNLARIATTVTGPTLVELGATVPAVSLTFADSSSFFDRATYMYVVQATAKWSDDGNASWYCCGNRSVVAGGVQFTLSLDLMPVDTAGRVYWQTMVQASDTTNMGVTYQYLIAPKMLDGDTLRVTRRVLPAMGLSLALSSPTRTGKFRVVVDSGGLPGALEFSVVPADTFHATMFVGLPAGTGYRVRAYALDLGTNWQAVASSLRRSGVNVASGAFTSLTMNLARIAWTLTGPTTVEAGASAPNVALTVSDSSSYFDSGQCMYLFQGTAKWTTDGNGNAPGSCNRSVVTGGVQFTAPLSQVPVDTGGVVYWQALLQWRDTTNLGVTYQNFIAPKMLDGDTLRATKRVAPAMGLSLTLSSPTRTGNFRVVVDSGGLPGAREFSVVPADTFHATMLVGLPAGTGYRVRVYAEDRGWINYRTVSSSLRRSGVNIASGAFTSLTMNLARIVTTVTGPTAVELGAAVPAVSLTFADSSSFFDRATCMWVVQGTAKWTNDGAASWYGCGSKSTVAGGVQFTASLNLMPMDTAGRAYWQTMVEARDTTDAGVNYRYLVAPMMLTGDTLRATKRVPPTTGISAAVTAPVGVSGFWIRARSQNTGQSYYASAPALNRTGTLLVGVPAGETYDVYVVGADSLATNPLTTVPVVASAYRGGIAVSAGVMSALTVPLARVTASLTGVSSTIPAGSAITGTFAVTDTAGFFSNLTSSATLYFGTGSFTYDLASAHGSQSIGTSTLAGYTRTWNLLSPAIGAAGTLNVQAAQRYSTCPSSCVTFYVAAPVRARGEAYQQVTVSAATQGIHITANSATPMNRFIAVIEGGAMSVPVTSSYLGSNITTATWNVGVPVGGPYTVRVLSSLDSLTSVRAMAGGRQGGVSVNAGLFTNASVSVKKFTLVSRTPAVQPALQPLQFGLTVVDSSGLLNPTQGYAYVYLYRGDPTSDFNGGSSYYTRTASAVGDSVRFDWATSGTLAVSESTRHQYRVYFGGSYVTPSGSLSIRFEAPLLSLGDTLFKVTAGGAASTLRVNATSPVPVRSFIVLVDSGGMTLPVSQRVDGTNMTSATIDVPLPAGTGYRVRVVGSLPSSTYGVTNVAVGSGFVQSGVSVAAGATQVVTATLATELPTLTLADSVLVGRAAPYAAVVQDRAALLLPTSAGALYNYTGGANPGCDLCSNSSVAQPATRVSGTWRWDGAYPGTNVPTTTWVSFGVASYVSTLQASYSFQFAAPSFVRAEPWKQLRIVTAPVKTLRVNVSHGPRAAKRYQLFVSKAGTTGAVPVRLFGTGMHGGTIYASVADTGLYTVKALAVDSASQSNQVVYSGMSTVTVGVADTTTLGMTLTAPTFTLVQAPTTTSASAATTFTWQVTDAAQMLTANSCGRVRYGEQLLSPMTADFSGGSSWSLCESTVPTAGVRQFSPVIAPFYQAGTYRYNLVAVERFSTSSFDEFFYWITPSMTLGESLRTLQVQAAAITAEPLPLGNAVRGAPGGDDNPPTLPLPTPEPPRAPSSGLRAPVGGLRAPEAERVPPAPSAAQAAGKPPAPRM